MDIDNKNTFSSLNNHINLYRDGLQIIEDILGFYKTFFDLIEGEENNRYIIIDYGVNIIDKYKKQWLEMLDDLLIFTNKKLCPETKGIKAEDFDNIIHGMETFFLKQYGLFLSSWDLEVATFTEKNSSIKKINFYMIEQSKEDIQKLNIKGIKEIIEVVGNEVRLELDKIIKAFNRRVLIEMIILKNLTDNEGSTDLSIFYDELSLKREIILNMIDDLQEKIKVLIEKKLVNKTLEQIKVKMEETLGVIIKKYKKQLNKYYVSTIGLMEKTIKYNYNKLIPKTSLYRRCTAVLDAELAYLQFVKSVGVECLRILEEEAEAHWGSMFNSEFYSGIYNLRFVSDFKNLIEAYKIKSDFILGNMVARLLKNFINRYYELILLMMKNRKDRIERLYVFKPITYMGDFYIYEPSVIIKLQRVLIDIYDCYDLKVNRNHEFQEIKRTYIGLNEDVEKSIEGFKAFLEHVEIREENKNSFKEEKIAIHKSITLLREELWSTINRRFIKVLKGFNSMIEGSIEHVEGEIRFYENNINYTDN